MSGKWKLVLSLAIILASASAASGRGREFFPTGPEWYLDEDGHWHSIRSDWGGIQRRSHAPRPQSSDYGQGPAEQ
jgi:hypothetical protein